MSGNKHDNGVHEVGTDETKKAYQEDTPGQAVEEYLSQVKVVNEERQKKHFSTKYPNPLKGFPYNEAKLEEACWDGYVQKGFKTKNGKQVPNCVPIGEEVTEDLTEKFNPKKELSAIKKMDKLLESAYKDMNKLQYGKSTYMMKVNDGIVEARRGLSKYQAAVENGELDDK